MSWVYLNYLEQPKLLTFEQNYSDTYSIRKLHILFFFLMRLYEKLHPMYVENHYQITFSQSSRLAFGLFSSANPRRC